MPEIQGAKAHLHPTVHLCHHVLTRCTMHVSVYEQLFDKGVGRAPCQNVHQEWQRGEGVPLHLVFLALEAGSGPDYLLTTALILGHTYRAVTRHCVAHIPGCERWFGKSWIHPCIPHTRVVLEVLCWYPKPSPMLSDQSSIVLALDLTCYSHQNAFHFLISPFSYPHFSSFISSFLHFHFLFLISLFLLLVLPPGRCQIAAVWRKHQWCLPHSPQGISLRPIATYWAGTDMAVPHKL